MLGDRGGEVVGRSLSGESEVRWDEVGESRCGAGGGRGTGRWKRESVNCGFV